MPPSWRPGPSYDAAVEQARGAFRDALGGLRNLDQLLRSMRVGPKALATVIPDVRAGCMTMPQSIGTLLDVLEPRLSGRYGAVRSLREFVYPCLDQIPELLAIEGPVNARTRLTLESRVRNAVDDLESVRGLLEVLVSATWGIAVRLELSDVVHQAFQDGHSTEKAESAELKATVAPPPGPVELLVNASAVVSLLSLVVNVVAHESNTVTPHIRIHHEPGTARGLVVSAQQGLGNTLSVTRQRLIAPTTACIEEAAQSVGAELRRDSETGTLSLIWQEVTESSRAGAS